MKLLFCTACQDVIRLFKDARTCKCGATGGRYLDGKNAEYWGANAMPLGFHNQEFLAALLCQPENGAGCRFDAFVIPKECPTMKKIKELPGDAPAG
jgi:hypothetical protein